MAAVEEQQQVVRANAKYVRSSARKARLITDLIRGRSVPEARTILAFSSRAVAKDGGHAVLRLPSGELRRVPLACRATVGQVGNVDHQNITGGKAGRSRWQGKHPAVRGSAMNPVDHPHGGGEGKSKGGRHPVTPWGVPTLGKRTRSKHKESNNLIVRGRRRGKEGRR